MRGRRNTGGLAFLLVVFAGGALDSPARAGLPPPYGGRVVLGQLGHLSLVSPREAETFAELLLVRQLHETMVRVYADGRLVPVMLERPPEPADSGREWILKLRPGLVDQAGATITATDVVASWQRLLSSRGDSPHWWLLAVIEGATDFHAGRAVKVRGLEVVNRLQLRVRLRVALPEFPQVLAAVPLAPLSTRFRTSGKPGPLPGSGPFLLQTVLPGQDQVKLAPFPRHCLGRPLLDLLEWKAYENEGTARLDMKLRRLDGLLDRDFPGQDLTVQKSAVGWPIMLVVNDKKLDELPEGFLPVLERLLDRESLVRYAVGGWGNVMEGFLESAVGQPSPGGEATPEEVSDFSRHLALQKGGTPPVLVFLVRRGAPVERRIAERIQVGLLKAGIVVSLLEQDSRQLRRKCRAGDYHLVLARPFIPCRDESLRLLGMLAAIHWLTGSDSLVKMMEDLLARMAQLKPDQQRRAVVRELARAYQRRLPVVPLLFQEHGLSRGQGLANLRLLLSGLVDLAEAWQVGVTE